MKRIECRVIRAHEPRLEPLTVEPLDQRAQIRLDRAVEEMGLDVRKAERRQRARTLVRGDMSSAVSVIIPTRDRGRLLAEAVRSALELPQPPLEVIVVDAGSTDGSTDDLEGARVLRVGPRNAAAARNAGAAVATGEYLGFVDSDDVALDGKTTCLAEELDADDRCARARHDRGDRRARRAAARADGAQRTSFHGRAQIGTTYPAIAGFARCSRR